MSDIRVDIFIFFRRDPCLSSLSTCFQGNLIWVVTPSWQGGTTILILRYVLIVIPDSVICSEPTEPPCFQQHRSPTSTSPRIPEIRANRPAEPRPSRSTEKRVDRSGLIASSGEDTSRTPSLCRYGKDEFGGTTTVSLFSAFCLCSF